MTLDTPSNNSPWYKRAVFYQVYIRAFLDSNRDGHGDLRGLTQKLDYLRALGVDCLWLMPMYPSPLADDGYDIADFFGIHADYGGLDDFRRLLEETHGRGMRLITDMVINHTSEAHPWFQAARRDRASPYRGYYVWSDDDQRYKEARIIFVDSQTSNWTWDAAAGQYYWHRFYPSQPDLNYDNPAVRDEMKRILRYWLDLGVDGFRVDAVPYLYERDGTSCENLPETHAFLKDLRQLVDAEYPDRLLLCEANQWPQDVRAYLADGDEFHMAFHFPLMPRIFMSIGRADAGPIRWALENTPEIPPSCQWGTFLRNHDELTLEMVSPEDRDWMWREYAPDPRMRLNLGIRRRLAPLLDHDRRKIELAHSLLFSLPGSPFMYYGDEIGMGDDISLPDRNGVRTPMQWQDAPNAGFSAAPHEHIYAPVIDSGLLGPHEINAAAQQQDPASLWNTIRRMVATRRAHPAFGEGDFVWLKSSSDKIAAYRRSLQHESIVVIQNLSASHQAARLEDRLAPACRDLLSGELIATKGGDLELKPYQYLWLQVPS